MKSSDYWRKRFELLEKAQYNKTSKLLADMSKSYRQAERELNKQISSWYGRFASNNGITFEEAKRLLNTKELAELKWEVDDYITAMEDNIDGKFAKELENASAQFHINRLESIKLQTKMEINKLMTGNANKLENHLEDVITDSYYRTAYEIQKGTELGYDLNEINKSRVKNILQKPWTADGNTFKTRCKVTQQQLVDSVHKALTKMVVNGENPDVVGAEISKKIGSAEYQGVRLARTESAYFSSVAEKECYKDIGVEEFKVSAIIDSRTSEICFNMHGKHFPMSEYEIGVTAPPFHPNCRSTTAPYFNDEFTQPQGKIDAETGKEIPEDMTYKEWRQQFLKKESKLSNANAEKFNKTLSEAKKHCGDDIRWRVSEYGSVDSLKDEHPNAKYFVTSGGSSIAVDGNGDIFGVCHSKYDQVRGKEMMAKAVEAGGNKLDSYSGNHGFYRKCGFEPVSWCEWNDEFAPSDWNADKHNREPIIFYMYTGKLSQYETADDFINAVKASSDYGEAMTTRDDLCNLYKRIKD